MKKSKLKARNQELKATNQRLTDDIYSLVIRPEELKTHGVRVLYEMKFRMQDQILSGSRQDNRPFTCDGFVSTAKNRVVNPKTFSEGSISLKLKLSDLREDSFLALRKKPYVPTEFLIKNIHVYNPKEGTLPFLAEVEIPEDKLGSSGYYCTHSMVAVFLKKTVAEILKENISVT